MEGENGVLGKHGSSRFRKRQNGERFIELCAANSMAITTTMFPLKDIHKYTWTSLALRPGVFSMRRGFKEMPSLSWSSSPIQDTRLIPVLFLTMC